MKKILVVNQPLNNRGDEAAHRAFMNLLASCDQCEFDILLDSNVTNSDISCLDGHYENIKYIVHPTIDCKGVLFVPKMRFVLPKYLHCMLFFWHPLLRVRKKIFSKYDLVLCAPGGVCMGPYRSWGHIFNLQLAIDLKIPFMIYGRSFGPLPSGKKHDKYFSKGSVDILKKARFISLRDRKSQDYAEELGVKYVPTIDAAFSSKITAVREDILGLNDKDYVVYVPNELCKWHVNYKGVPSESFDILYLNIISLLEKKYHIVMLPQLYNREYGDTIYFKHLKEISNSNNITVVSDEYDSNVQQQIISNAKIVIGARYHSIIFAINNCVPFVALSYEHKMTNTLEILKLTDCECPIGNALRNPELATAKIDSVVNNIDKTRKEICQANTVAKKIVSIANQKFIDSLMG